MPQLAVAAISTALTSIGFSAGVASVIATTIVSAATSLIVGAATTALFKRDAPSASILRQVTFKDPVATRPIIYGQTRTGGALVFAEGSSDKRWLYLIIVLAGHECEEIGTVYLNDEELTINGSGYGTGRFLNQLYIGKHLGAYDQTADSLFVSDLNGWSGEHRLRGLCYLAMKVKVNQLKTYPNFSYSAITAEVKGRKVYDPRDSGQTKTDPSTWAYSNNAALCMADYIRGVPIQDSTGTIKRLMGLRAADISVDWSQAQVAANTCDESVSTSAGGTVSRYTIDGRISSSERPNDVIENMALAMAGGAIYTAGTWYIQPGEAQTATIEFDENDVMAPMEVQPRRSRRDIFNAVRAVYQDRGDGWQPKDAPELTNAFYEAQDNDERLYTDVAFPYVTYGATVQRLMSIFLLKNRQQIQLVLPVGLKGLKVKAGDWVLVSNTYRGWSQKKFEVTGWQLVTRDGGDGTPVIGVDLELQETADEIYDWDAADVTVDPAPDTNLIDPSDITNPTDLTLTSGADDLFVASDGTVVSRIKATWTLPDDGMVNAFEFEYKKNTESDYTRVIIPGETVSYYISPVEDGIDYNVRIRSRNIFGATPDDYLEDVHTVVGKSDPPEDITSFAVSRLADGTRRFTWGTVSDADLAGYRIKYDTGGSITWATATALHDGLLTASPFEVNGPAAGTYTFGIKAVDTSGNESTNEAVITQTLGDPRLKDVLAAYSERDDGWTGTLSGLFINDNNYLEATGDTSGSPQSDWSSLPATWADLDDSWDALVTTTDPVTYTTPVYDLGADVSFTPFVTVTTNNTASIQMKTGTEDDGTVTGSFVDVDSVAGKRYAQFEITVSGDATLITGIDILLDGEVLTDRYEDIDTSSITSPNIERVAAGHIRVAIRKTVSSITQAQITALQNVGNGWTWELISKNATWSGSPQPSNDSAEFKIYNASGTLADATVDIELRGPKAE